MANVNENSTQRRPQVVVVGAGFGGTNVVKHLARLRANVILIDRDNYFTFVPLLYQVAAAEVGPTEIGYPVRKMLQKYRNARFVLGNVKQVDPVEQVVRTDHLAIPYDYLVLAPGSVSTFFNIPGAAEHSLPLKDMEQAINLRNHILNRFERAVYEPDEDARRRLLNFVIVGGGPTGVEFAGALIELIHGPLQKDYPTLDFREVRVILVEAADRLLAALPEKHQVYTKKRLEKMGVEVTLNAMVSEVAERALHFKDGRTIESETIIWTAGVQGNPAPSSWGLPAGKGNLIEVLPTLQVKGFPNIYAIGDAAMTKDDEGKPYPMLAPVAIQAGGTAAKNIARQIAGRELIPYRYKGRGTMATIGRNAAVAQIGKWMPTGYIAWIMWVTVHLFKLIGFRNKLLVMINWAWDYLFFERALRIITPRDKRLDTLPPPSRPNVLATKEMVEERAGRR